VWVGGQLTLAALVPGLRAAVIFLAVEL
jgi:hypothetical protein